jgi:hypothetical protein
MKWLVSFVLLAACSSGPDPVSLEGPYACGPKTCATGEICLIQSSGSQCQVNPDAGIGQYQEYAWDCVAIPEECDGVPSCDCVTPGGMCFGTSEDGRTVYGGCI